MQGSSLRKAFGLLAIALMVLSSATLIQIPAASAASAGGNTNITAYNTNYGITVDGYAEEPFWSSIPWTTLQLSPSDQYAGAVSSVEVKIAHNSTWIFILARWRDTTESRITDPVIRNSTGGYIYNSTYYYGDILWAEWSLFGGGSIKPNVTAFAHTRFAGTPGSGKAGLEANLWSWRSYEDAGGPAYPYHYFPPPVYTWGPQAGQPLVFPYSAAYDSYLNGSAQYFVGTGVMRVEACAAPLNDLDPFVNRAMGSWADNYWTVEMARPFTSPANTSNALFDVQFKEGQSYWAAFLVANGNQGEVYSTNDVSPWVQITISPQYDSAEQAMMNANTAATQATYVAIAAIAVAAAAVLVAIYPRMRRKEQ